MTEQTAEKSLVRPMAPADLENVLAWRNHPDVRRFMLTQREITLDEHLRWFDRARQDPLKCLLIFETDSQPLGFVNFSRLTGGGIADWGFYAAPQAPKGSGKRLCSMALNHAFTQLKLHKICGRVLACNRRSIHLHKFLRFQEEGVLRDQHFDGERYRHVICFGLLSHEWQSI